MASRFQSMAAILLICPKLDWFRRQAAVKSDWRDRIFIYNHVQQSRPAGLKSFLQSISNFIRLCYTPTECAEIVRNLPIINIRKRVRRLGLSIVYVLLNVAFKGQRAIS